MKNHLTVIITLFIAGMIYAQETGENNLGSWYMYHGNHKILEKLSINSGLELKDYETVANFNQLIAFTGINYTVSKRLTATLGYSYLNTDSSFEEFPGEVNTQENRLFEQLSLKDQLWKFNLSHRYRLEHRFLDFNNRIDTQHRVRYRLQARLPLDKTLFLNLYDEIFLNLQNSVFSQNRIYVGLGVKLNQSSSVQLGHLKNRFSSVSYDRLQFTVSIKTGMGINKGLHDLSKSSKRDPITKN